jgi:hypothetical protein
MPSAQETDDEGEDDTRDNQVSLHHAASFVPTRDSDIQLIFDPLTTAV